MNISAIGGHSSISPQQLMRVSEATEKGPDNDGDSDDGGASVSSAAASEGASPTSGRGSVVNVKA